MGQYISVNPWTGKEIGRRNTLDFKELEERFIQTEKARERWGKMVLEQRLERIRNLCFTLRANKKHYALSVTHEMGKRIVEAELEIEKCATLCEYYLDCAPEVLHEKVYAVQNAHVRIRAKSQGIVFGIMPWNFPFWQVFRLAIPNLILGNAVWIKHASSVALTAQLIEEAFIGSGFPKGLFTNVYIDSNDVEWVIADPRVRGVSLTGSEQAGRSVAALAGKHLKKTVLELGGSNAFLMLEDASIKKAVKEAVKGRLVNSGQSCIASKRFIIPKSKEREFVERLEANLAELRIGDPLLATTTLAPLARVDLAKELEDQVQQTIDQGARLKGELVRHETQFTPVILQKVKPGMLAFDQELFGPVFSVTTYKTDSEAIKLVNKSRFGLGATIFGKKESEAIRIANQLDEGSVYINSAVYSHPAIPFGGVKNSGYGREMAKEGLLEFANIQPLVKSLQ